MHACAVLRKKHQHSLEKALTALRLPVPDTQSAFSHMDAALKCLVELSVAQDRITAMCVCETGVDHA